MKTKKVRRHSGRVTPHCTVRYCMSKQNIIDECLDPQPFWDDWTDYRDGWRANGKGWISDHCKNKKKICLHKKIRQAKKIKKFIYN